MSVSIKGENSDAGSIVRVVIECANGSVVQLADRAGIEEKSVGGRLEGGRTMEHNSQRRANGRDDQTRSKTRRPTGGSPLGCRIVVFVLVFFFLF